MLILRFPFLATGLKSPTPGLLYAFWLLSEEYIFLIVGGKKIRSDDDPYIHHYVAVHGCREW